MALNKDLRKEKHWLQQDLEEKKYTWVLLYIGLLMAGQQIAGIGGAVGGGIIADGIRRTVTNPNLSKTKKWINGILYTLGGILIGAVITFVLVSFLAGVFGPNYIANINAKTNIEQNYTVDEGFKSYKNPNMEISITSYPADWSVDESEDKWEVYFEAPDNKTSITVRVFALDTGKTLDLNTFVAALQKADREDPRLSFEKTREEIRTINGKKWLVLDGILRIGKNYTSYERMGIFQTGKYEGQQYLLFILETDKDRFATEAERFDRVLESARFYS